MNDRHIAELVTQLTSTARDYAHTQQLRQRIAYLVVPALREIEGATASSLNRFADQVTIANAAGNADLYHRAVTDLVREVRRAQAPALPPGWMEKARRKSEPDGELKREPLPPGNAVPGAVPR